MGEMFMNSSLSSLDVSKFETENVLIMTKMFKNIWDI